MAAADFLRHELGRRVVELVGRCRIEYDGRAASTLASGERLMLFKPDGTLLVHTAAKLKPVNWQPPGCTFSASVEDGKLVVTALREKPREMVRIVMDDIAAILSFALMDTEELALVGSEDDLQAYLAANPQLIEPGFSFWSRERDSQLGPMDLYGEDAKGNRVVIEVKRRPAQVGDGEQLRRYVERERKARGTASAASEGRKEFTIRGILVAPVVSEVLRRYLNDLGFEWREIDWDKLARKASALRGAGQATLGRFERPER
ncbi:MAG: endonuclease NucS [Thermoplasmatota archaeon]